MTGKTRCFIGLVDVDSANTRESYKGPDTNAKKC